MGNRRRVSRRKPPAQTVLAGSVIRIAHAVFCSLCGLLVAGSVGCTALPGENVFTLKQTDLNVHWKMTQYNAVGPFGGVTHAQAQSVDAAYKAYQEAFDRALKEAHGNQDAPTPPYLQQKANQLIQVLTSVLSTLTGNFGPSQEMNSADHRSWI